MILIHLVFLIIIGLRASGALQALEFKVYDAFLMKRAKAAEVDPRIIVIGVNEEDFYRWGWPLSDARLVQLMKILVEAKPRVIGMDLYRDRPVPWDPQAKSFPDFVQLNTMIKAHTNIIGVIKFQEIKPAPAFTESNRFGFSDLLPDSEGIIRRGLLFLNDEQGRVYFSFSLKIALQYLANLGVKMQPDPVDPEYLRLGKITIPPLHGNDGAYISEDDSGYQFLLDYSGLPKAFKTLTLNEVFTGNNHVQLLKDRIVIVGITAKSEKDFFYSPNNNYSKSARRLSGAAMHGHMVSQILRMALDGDSPVISLSEPGEWGWIWVWSIVGGLIAFWVLSFWRQVAIIIAGLLALVLVYYLMFTKKLWLPIVPSGLAWVSSAMVVTAYRSSREWIQRRLLMQMFSCYVPKSIATELWRQRNTFLAGGKPQPQRLVGTVLFSDLKGFTSVSESLSPETLMIWLNTYMENMAEIVNQHHGVIDKFIGDSIMVVFGVPTKRIDHSDLKMDAEHAIRCAFAMSDSLGELNKQWREQGLPTVNMRIGIATGLLVAGSVGSRNRLEYTVIGDTVNIASRLESFDKNYCKDEKCRILISETTLDYLDNQFTTQPVGEVTLKGKLKKIKIFRVLPSLTAQNANGKS